MGNPAIGAVDLEVVDLDVANRMEGILSRDAVLRGALRELHFVIIVLTGCVIILLTTRMRWPLPLQLKTRIDRLGFHRQNCEHSLVHSPQGLLFDEAFQRLEAE